MSSAKPPKHRAGRRPNTIEVTIRTLAWIRYVLWKSQKNPYQLGLEFHPDKYGYIDKKTRSSKRWERYAEGVSNPQDPKKGKSLIDRVEVVYEGSALIFRHPLWAAIKGDIRDSQEVSKLLMMLDCSVTDICFVPEKVRSKATLKRTPYDYGMPARLSYLRSVDALAALLLLSIEAELTGNSRMHAQIVINLGRAVFQVRDEPEIKFVIKELVDCINRRVHSHHYYLKDGFSWQAPRISLEAVMGHGQDYEQNDPYTALELRLYERLSIFFGSPERFQSWLNNFHSVLGETPQEAMRHTQGLQTIASLLSD